MNYLVARLAWDQVEGREMTLPSLQPRILNQRQYSKSLARVWVSTKS